jgi:hypothetical protein
MLIFQTQNLISQAKSIPSGSPLGIGHHLNSLMLGAGLFLSPCVRYRFGQLPLRSTIGALHLWY